MVVQLHKRGLLGCPICICTKCTHHLPFSTCIKFGGDWRHKRPINSLTFPESGDFLLCTISTRICHYSIGGGFVHQGFFCGFMLFSLPTSDLRWHSQTRCRGLFRIPMIPYQKQRGSVEWRLVRYHFYWLRIRLALGDVAYYQFGPHETPSQ